MPVHEDCVDTHGVHGKPEKTCSMTEEESQEGEPVEQKISRPQKLGRRKSQLKTGYKVELSNLSEDYFRSIFTLRKYPLVTALHLDKLLASWKKHAHFLGPDSLSEKDDLPLFPRGLEKMLHDQLEDKNSQLVYGHLKLKYGYKRLFQDQQTMELSKSALMAALTQVPIIKSIDFSEVGLTENTATQILICMEHQLEISGILSDNRVSRALREEKVNRRKSSPPASPQKPPSQESTVGNSQGKYSVQPPQIAASPDNYDTIETALKESGKIDCEPLYYLEDITYSRKGPARIKRTNSIALFNRSFVNNTEEKVRASKIKIENQSSAKLEKLLNHCKDAGAKLYSGNARLDAVRTFQSIDKDLSGQIDTVELRSALEVMGLDVTDELIEDIMLCVDLDRGGTVSEEEFTTAIMKRSAKLQTEKAVHRELLQIMPPQITNSRTIHPNSEFMHTWDVLIVLLLVYTATFTIFEICFLGSSGELDSMFWVNRAIDFIFFVDLVMHFFIMVPRKNTEAMISDLHTIATMYLKSWFIVDLVSVIPYDVFALGGDDGTDVPIENLRVLRLLRLLRLLKLARVLRGFRIVQRWEDIYGVTVKYSLQQIAKFMIGMIIICHWIACVWRFVTVFDTENTSWIIVNDYADFDVGELYFVCVYWALQTISTIGYGDVANPNTVLERIIAIIAMIIGSIVWAYLMGVIVSNAVSLDKLEQDHHARMDNLEVFMGEKQLDYSLRRRLRFYFRRRRSLDTMNNFQDLLRSMSPSLRGDVALSITSKWLPKVPWLRYGEKNFVTSIALNLRPEIYPPMEMVAGDIFHVVSRGIAIKDMRVFCGGMVWGLDMILSNTALRRTKPAIALTFLETSSLSRTDFMHVLERFPREKKAVRRSVIWLAFRRKFTSHAQEIEKMTDNLSKVLRRDALSGAINVRQVFKNCDKDDDGELDFFEFSNGLRALGFDPSQEVLENLMIRFRGHNEGSTISISDFIEFFSVRHRPKRHGMDKLPLLDRRKSLLGMTRNLAEQGSIIDADAIKQSRLNVGTGPSISSGDVPLHHEILERHEGKLGVLETQMEELLALTKILVAGKS